MALLIGAVIFGAAYALLPELIKKPRYSRRLGWWHLWMTMIGGYGNAIIWYIQGLNGGPHRFSVLPEAHDTLTLLSVPFVLLMALGQLVFAYNVIQSVRGRRRANDSEPFLVDPRQLGLASLAVTVAVLLPGAFIALDRMLPTRPDVAPAAVAEKPLSPEAEQGRELFTGNAAPVTPSRRPGPRARWGRTSTRHRSTGRAC
ncbi:MAG: hypothetical protein FJW90_00120 [Actinobacteria bacterium]|nr:hypothetical protein [Actinomycetota bacterium]